MDFGLSTRSTLWWALLGLTAAALWISFDLWPSLILAAWTAALMRPLLVRFERGLKGRRRAAAALSFLLFVVLLLPLGLIALGVFSGAQDLVHAVSQMPSAKSALEAIATGTAAAPAPELPRSLPSAMELLQRYGEQGVKVASNVAGAAARGLVALFVYFSGAYVFLVSGPDIWSWLKRNSPFEQPHLERFASAFQETGRGLLVGVGLTSAAQGLVATIAYFALGVPRWWVLGPVSGLASIVPLVGSALIWGPLTVGLFLTGHIAKGFILAGLGIGVVGAVDNLLRPLFARIGALKLPAFLMFVSIFGGITAFGPWGAILGPLVVRLWMEAVALRSDAKPGRAQSPAPVEPLFKGGARR